MVVFYSESRWQLICLRAGVWRSRLYTWNRASIAGGAYLLARLSGMPIFLRVEIIDKILLNIL
jgi:hypothetical protein